MKFTCKVKRFTTSTSSFSTVFLSGKASTLAELAVFPSRSLTPCISWMCWSSSTLLVNGWLRAGQCLSKYNKRRIITPCKLILSPYLHTVPSICLHFYYFSSYYYRFLLWIALYVSRVKHDSHIGLCKLALAPRNLNKYIIGAAVRTKRMSLEIWRSVTAHGSLMIIASLVCGTPDCPPPKKREHQSLKLMADKALSVCQEQRRK